MFLGALLILAAGLIFFAGYALGRSREYEAVAKIHEEYRNKFLRVYWKSTDPEVKTAIRAEDPSILAKIPPVRNVFYEATFTSRKGGVNPKPTTQKPNIRPVGQMPSLARMRDGSEF